MVELAVANGFLGFSGSAGFSLRLPNPFVMLSNAFEISPSAASPPKELVVAVVVDGVMLVLPKSNDANPAVLVSGVVVVPAGFGAVRPVVVVVVGVVPAPKPGSFIEREVSCENRSFGFSPCVAVVVVVGGFSVPLSPVRENAGGFPDASPVSEKVPSDPNPKLREDLPALSLVFLGSTEAEALVVVAVVIGVVVVVVVVVVVDTAGTSGIGDAKLKSGQASVVVFFFSSVLCRRTVGESDWMGRREIKLFFEFMNLHSYLPEPLLRFRPSVPRRRFIEEDEVRTAVVGEGEGLFSVLKLRLSGVLPCRSLSSSLESLSELASVDDHSSSYKNR